MSILDCLLHGGMDGFKPSYHLGTPLENLSQGIKYKDKGYWLPDGEVEPISIKNMDLIHIISTKKALKKAYRHYNKKVRNENSYKMILGMIDSKIKEFDVELKRRGCVPLNIILPEEVISNKYNLNIFIQFKQSFDDIELILRTPKYVSKDFKKKLADRIQKVLGSIASPYYLKEVKIKGKINRNPLWYIDKTFRSVYDVEDKINSLSDFCKENNIGFKPDEITGYIPPKKLEESDLEDLSRKDVYKILSDLVEDMCIDEETLLNKIEDYKTISTQKEDE